MLYIKGSGSSEADPLDNSKGGKTDRVLFAGFANKPVNYVAAIKVSNNWFLRLCSRITYLFTHSLIKVGNPEVLGGHQWVLINDNSLKNRLGFSSIQEMINTPAEERASHDKSLQEMINMPAEELASHDKSLNTIASTELPVFTKVLEDKEIDNVAEKAFIAARPIIGEDPRISVIALEALREQTVAETSTSGVKLLSNTNLCRDILVVDGKRYMLLREKDDKIVGKGACKPVYYAIDLETGEKCAVSIFSKFQANADGHVIPKPDDLVDLARKEARLMGTFGKEGGPVIGSAGFIETDDEIITLMEYCDGGDLSSVMNTLKSEDQPRMAQEILEGALAVEKQGYIHRDLKPDNIFMKTGEDGRLHPVIGDLGVACKKGGAEGVEGTAEYMPLKLQLPGKRDRELQKEEMGKMDAWALGLILYQMFHPQHENCVALKNYESDKKELNDLIIEGQRLERQRAHLDSKRNDPTPLPYTPEEIPGRIEQNRKEIVENQKQISALWERIQQDIEGAVSSQANPEGGNLQDLQNAGVKSNIRQAISGLLQVDSKKRMSIEAALDLVKQAS